MIINETKACYGFRVTLDRDGDFCMEYQGYDITCDREQAEELLPILEHFIKTGELPE